MKTTFIISSSTFLYSVGMLEEIQRLIEKDKFFKIAVYVFVIGLFAAVYMTFTTYLHYLTASKLPDSSEFFNTKQIQK